MPLTLWNLAVGYPLDAPWYLVLGAGLAIGLILWGNIRVLRQYRNEPQRSYWLVLLLPAVLLLLLWGAAALPHRVSRVALVALLVVMGANIIREFARDDHIRAEWDVVTSQIEGARKPNEAILTAYFYMLQHYAEHPEDLEAVLGEIHDTSTGPTFVIESGKQHDNYSAVWIVLRTYPENVHRTGRMPDTDPFENSDDLLVRWLAQHRDQITDRWRYNGMSLFRLQLDETSTHR